MKKIAAAFSVSLLAVASLAAVPEIVNKEATFWLDASTLEQAAGTELDSWSDVRGGDIQASPHTHPRTPISSLR